MHQGTVSVISSDYSCKDDNTRFTRITIKALSDQAIFVDSEKWRYLPHSWSDLKKKKIFKLKRDFLLYGETKNQPGQ